MTWPALPSLNVVPVGRLKRSLFFLLGGVSLAGFAHACTLKLVWEAELAAAHRFLR